MSEELESCPVCGALPCDQVELVRDHYKLPSPRAEDVRREALEEAATLRGLISEMLEYRVVDESWEARAIRALSPPVKDTPPTNSTKEESDE